MTGWEEELRGLFEDVREPLAHVLDANGCREGWLQGEAFRHFRQRDKAIYTNYVTLPSPGGLKNRKADLAIYSGHDDAAKLQLIGEIKIYGERGYYEKNLTGGSLSEVRRRAQGQDGPITFQDRPEDRQLVAGYGLLADHFRLVDFSSADEPARVLLLCVQKHRNPDPFGKLLRQLEFGCQGTVLCETDSFWAKCWSVGRPGRG